MLSAFTALVFTTLGFSILPKTLEIVSIISKFLISGNFLRKH